MAQATQDKAQENGNHPLANATWNVVRTEQPDRIVFEEAGDCIIGRLVAKDTIQPPDEVDAKTGEKTTPEPFLQLVWRDALVGNVGDVQAPDYTKLQPMPYVSTNAGWALESAYAEIPLDTWTRNTLVKTVKVKNQASPMKDFRVETANS
jgi:hypothetical protein